MNLKNNILRLFIVFLSAIILPSATFGQPEKTGSGKVIVSFVPQFLINNGIRIDYDRQINENNWLQVAPQFYLRERSSSSDNEFTDRYNSLLGAGLHVYHRYYPGKGAGINGVYLSYGLTCQFFNLQYDEKIMTNSVERYSKITKTGAEINIGKMVKISNLFIVDFYTGLGFKYSFLKSDAKEPKRFDNFYTDYGYTGNILNLGVRIGLAL